MTPARLLADYPAFTARTIVLLILLLGASDFVQAQALAPEQKSQTQTTTAANIVTTGGPAGEWQCKEQPDTNKWQCNAAAAHTRSAVESTKPASQPDTAEPELPAVQTSSPLHQNDYSSQPIDYRNLAQQDWHSLPPKSSNIHQTPTATLPTTPYCNGVYINPIGELPDSSDQDPSSLPIEASADSSAMQNGIATFDGAVLVTHGSSTLQADRATYNTASGQVDLDGNVIVRTAEAAFGGTDADVDLNDRSTVIRNANYVVHQQHIRGTADQIQANTEGQITISKGSYTQCSPTSKLWSIKASKIKLDHNSGQGTATHARVKIQGLPIAYLPYARFPIGDARQSGFLFPSLSDTESGFDITLPYYFNIAANADATLAPRYNDMRGYITEAEFRWLNHFDQWKVSGAYIGNDRQFANEQGNENIDSKRWVVDIEERGSIARQITTSVDYTRVSDNDYLRDLNTTSLSVSRTTHLSQRVGINLDDILFKAGVNVQQYQTISSTSTGIRRPFEKNPEAWLGYESIEKPFRLGANANIRYTSFSHEELMAGDRMYSEANINYPMRWQGIHIVPSVGIQNLEYSLDDDIIQTDFDRKPSTTAPQAMFDAKMILEKSVSRRQQLSRRTIEPGLLYVYRDADPQDEFPLFDTDVLTTNRNQLFRSTQLSGYDRLEDANQLAVYFTRRVFDQRGSEKLSATLGQIFYFQDTRPVDLPAAINNTATTSNLSPEQRTSALIGDLNIELGNNWRNTSTLLWDSDQNIINEGSVNFRYRSPQPRTSIANIGYHFRRQDLRTPVLQDDIELGDISFITPVSKHWGLIGRYQYDITLDRNSESLAGLEYNSCCIKLRVVYRDALIYNGRDALELASERDRSLFLQIELKGLFGVGNTIENILDESVFGYRSKSGANAFDGTDDLVGTNHTTF